MGNMLVLGGIGKMLPHHAQTHLHTHAYIHTHTCTGPPSYPEPFLQLINATTLLLSWFPPFTWPDFEIINYSIKMMNTTNGDTFVRNVNATPNETIINEYFITPNGEATQSCFPLKFAVSATSTIGESRPGNTSGGFPIG